MKVSRHSARTWAAAVIFGSVSAQAGDWDSLFQRLRNVDERPCPYTVGSPGSLAGAAVAIPSPSDRVQRAPAVVSVDAVFPADPEPIESEVKLRLDCPAQACEVDRRAEFLKQFKTKVSEKKIWLYDFADRRLKDRVTIRKRTEKGQTLLTVKLKNLVAPGTPFPEAAKQLSAIYQKYLASSASAGVKGNKCEQDWNEVDGDRSPYSCSFTIALTPEQAANDKPTPQNLLSKEQRDFICEYKEIDLAKVTEPFAPPAYYDSEERKLLADTDVSVETWTKPNPGQAGTCYAFEISKKVPADEAPATSKQLNELVKSALDPAVGCPLKKPLDQNHTKSM